MSVFDSFREAIGTDDQDPDLRDDADAEQLADGEPDPKGESRDDGPGSWLLGYRSSSTSSGAGVAVDHSDAPETTGEYWTDYYREFPLTRAALTAFDSMVAEPGYRIEARDADGDTDDDMTEALELWAANCVIHAGEWGHDLSALLEQLPSKRRGKGTVFVEKVGTTTDRSATAALMLLDPTTIRIYKREDQNLLVQPGDSVDRDHPRTDDGDAAAYVQYDEELTGNPEKDPIPFAADELVKLVYDCDEGEAWGTSIFEALDDRIDALQKKLEDRDLAIEQAGHPHRIYHSEHWSLDEAKEYAKAHERGDVSANNDETDGRFAGRVDFVNDAVEHTVVEGDVADLADPVRDDIEQIFSLLPISKVNIAYADDLNQFAVEPQMEKDDRTVDDERRYLERKLEPVLEEKADELASGDEYDGEISFAIESPPEDNPLNREDFPAENLEAFVTAWAEWKKSGADMDLPAGALADFMGFDLEDVREQFGAPEQYDPAPIAPPPADETDQDGGAGDVDDTADDSGAGGDMPGEGEA